jgi:small-conductance mechanosensitive channel
MKKLGSILVGSILMTLAASLSAQTTPAAPSAPQQQQQPGTQPPASLQDRMAEARRQQEAEMQQVKAELDRMRTMVDKMRSDAAKINDQAAKSAITTNADIWQSWIDSMQRRIERMRAAMEQQGPPPSPPSQGEQKPPPR